MYLDNFNMQNSARNLLSNRQVDISEMNIQDADNTILITPEKN